MEDFLGGEILRGNLSDEKCEESVGRKGWVFIKK